jgi:hypothetical protein
MDAIKKQPGKPYLIFLDVNLPGLDPSKPADPGWFKEIGQDPLPGLPREHQGKICMVLCSNIAFHWTPKTAPAPMTVFSAHTNPNPDFPVEDSILEALVQAARLFQNVPREFPVKD